MKFEWVTIVKRKFPLWLFSSREVLSIIIEKSRINLYKKRIKPRPPDVTLALIERRLKLYIRRFLPSETDGLSVKERPFLHEAGSIFHENRAYRKSFNTISVLLCPMAYTYKTYPRPDFWVEGWGTWAMGKAIYHKYLEMSTNKIKPEFLQLLCPWASLRLRWKGMRLERPATNEWIKQVISDWWLPETIYWANKTYPTAGMACASTARESLRSDSERRRTCKTGRIYCNQRYNR
jgi:hypothetical protein